MSKIQERITEQMKSTALCATCALRDSCNKSATINHWRSLGKSCASWEKWNER